MTRTLDGSKKRKRIYMFHVPLGGDCGKSCDNNNFMRNTPFSYGVPAVRESSPLIKQKSD